MQFEKNTQFSDNLDYATKKRWYILAHYSIFFIYFTKYLLKEYEVPTELALLRFVSTHNCLGTDGGYILLEPKSMFFMFIKSIDVTAMFSDILWLLAFLVEKWMEWTRLRQTVFLWKYHFRYRDSLNSMNSNFFGWTNMTKFVSKK